MSDQDQQGSDGQVVEIDWTPIEMAIDGLVEGGLELEDGPVVLDHIAALLASCLRRLHEEDGWDEDKVGESAAEVAAFAIELALGEDDLPAFEAWEGDEDGEDDDDGDDFDDEDEEDDDD